MPEVVDWLKTLGMSEYAERFAESDIDMSVLCELTDQDLKELGVSLGHRRKMLRAIAELVAVPPTQLQPALTEPKPEDTAERRQVTVMFSDLVGSTALSARMDPEDLREVISAYQKCVAETVQRFGGFVAKYMGDGVLVYFGYPASARGRCRASGTGGAGIDPSGGSAEVRCSTANPRWHCYRVGRSRRPDLDRVRLRSKRLSARRRTLRRACKGSPSRTRWSSPKEPGDFLAICLSLRTSGQKTSRVSPARCEPGRRCGRVRRKAASRHCTRRV